MDASAPSTLPGQVQLTDFDLSLEPGDARHPLRPVVQGLRLRVSDRGLRLLTQELVAQADRRAPVDVHLQHIGVGPDGIEVALKVAKSIIRGELATRLVLSAPRGQELRIALTDTQMPAWMPLDMLLDEAVNRAAGGVRRDPENPRALLLDPAALLARFGVPGRFAPGLWNVATGAEGIELAFRESAAGA